MASSTPEPPGGLTSWAGGSLRGCGTREGEGRSGPWNGIAGASPLGSVFV
jgi:hypothetical protein